MVGWVVVRWVGWGGRVGGGGVGVGRDGRVGGGEVGRVGW